MTDLSNLTVTCAEAVREVMTAIDRNARGIALVVDSDGRLVDTVTDGDVRRALLEGVGMSAPINVLVERKRSAQKGGPITAEAHADRSELLQLMRLKNVRQVPLLDGAGCVVDLVTLEDLFPDDVLPVHAVVMAGGVGKRLRPLTEDVPKPMLPVGDRPLMERLVDQLRFAGIRHVSVTTHYKPDAITGHFGDGGFFGVSISYVHETEPLGTAGALGLLESSDEPILVINGDVVTSIDFKAMLSFHKQERAVMTVGVREYDVQIPYGVVETAGPTVQRVVEKPNLKLFVNAGIYLLEPSVPRQLDGSQRCDMPELISRLLSGGRRVVAYTVREYWLDIGRVPDYEQAQMDVRAGKV